MSIFEVERLKWEVKHLQETINDIVRILVDVKDYEASNDCACTLTNISKGIFGLCTEYDCPDRKRCNGNCNNIHNVCSFSDDDDGDNNDKLVEK